jgi:hypothetical protein
LLEAASSYKLPWTRILIEQAKGVLAERESIRPDEVSRNLAVPGGAAKRARRTPIEESPLTALLMRRLFDMSY